MSFKTTYKGAKSQGVTYDYKCCVCGELHQEKHSMSEAPLILCSDVMCSGSCIRVILSAPSLGADHHDSMKYHNLGWEEQ